MPPQFVYGSGASLSGASTYYGVAWGPSALAVGLQYPVQYGWNGAQVNVAIVSASNVYASDLSTYNAFFGTPQTGRSYFSRPVDNATVTTIGSDLDESTLDVETIEGLAPGANVYNYVVPSLATSSLLDGFEAMLSDKFATVASTSFGLCEASLAPSSLQAADAVFQSAAMSAVTVVAASGDQGGACSDGSSGLAAGVMYPASDPWVIGVGGTETVGPTGNLSTTTSSAVWNDSLSLSTSGPQEASGGGISTNFGLPFFQQGLSGVASSTERNVPDVAMPASAAAVVVQNQWKVLNGTSWGAPQFAAMLAEIYQYCRTTGITFAVQLPYLTAMRSYNSSFIDVVSGNNGFSLSTGSAPAYSAHAGYDNASGLGVPLGMQMANSICPGREFEANIMRSPASVMPLSLTSRGGGPYKTDATPRVADIHDEGQRPSTQLTAFQLVVLPQGDVASNEAKVRDLLISSGFTIVHTFPNHLVIDALGPTQAIESLFAATIHDVSSHNVRAYMPANPITVPVSLAPYLAGVILDDVPMR